MKLKLLALTTLAVWGLSLGVSTGAQGARKDKALPDALNVSPAEQVLIEVGDEVVRQSLPGTLFGFNINYRSFQEQLWDGRRQAVKPGIIEQLRAFDGALYRYPGGLVANGFSWSQSVGPVDERKPQKAVIGERPVKVTFGLDEYLDFVSQVKGRPWYVLNLVGLDPMQPMMESDPNAIAKDNQGLAKHLLARKVPSPHYYQLGNELDRAEYEWSAEKYVARSRASIEAIREVDKDARFVAFLRDFKWNYRRQPERGVSAPEAFLREVTSDLPGVEDYSLHHYYDGRRDDGKSRDIPFWLRAAAASIASYRASHDGRAPRIWITEHARQKSSDRPGSDPTREYTSNLGGALSTADYLIAIAQVPEIQGACWHGLNAGPWQLFDATIKYRDLRPRPIYWGLRVLREMRLPIVLKTQTRSPNHSGYKGGYDVRAVGFRDQAKETFGLWVVNRAPEATRIVVAYEPLKGRQAVVTHYYLAGEEGVDPDALRSDPRTQMNPSPTRVQVSEAGRLTLSVPPASVSTFLIRPGAGGE